MWRGGDSYVHQFEYEHSIDRAELSAAGKVSAETGDVFYVTWGVDGCLYLYPQHDWEELAQETAESAVQSAEPFDPETVNGIRHRS